MSDGWHICFNFEKRKNNTNQHDWTGRVFFLLSKQQHHHQRLRSNEVERNYMKGGKKKKSNVIQHQRKFPWVDGLNWIAKCTISILWIWIKEYKKRKIQQNLWLSFLGRRQTVLIERNKDVRVVFFRIIHSCFIRSIIMQTQTILHTFQVLNFILLSILFFFLYSNF